MVRNNNLKTSSTSSGSKSGQESRARDKLTAIAIRMKKGDRRAAAELYDELLPKVHGFLFTRTGKREVAEDLAHDVFIKLIEKIGAFDETRGSFVVWFWQVVRRMLIDFYRKKQELTFSNFEEREVEEMAVTMIDAGETVDEKMRYEKVSVFLRELTADERELFEYRYIAELSYSEIAKLTNKSEGALRVASLRVKEKIKKRLNHV
jgi:RNA polymerase sigma-70 factor (ECF subfamily)